MYEEIINTLGKGMARSIIRSLADGVVPDNGASLFTFGRDKWLQSLNEDLEDLSEDDCLEGRLRIFNGRNGDGKTHLMHLLREKAMDLNFVVSYVVISELIPLYRWDLVYAAIGSSLSTRGKSKGGGLRAILNPKLPDSKIVDNFREKAGDIRSVHGIDPNFASVVYRYCTEQTVNVDADQDMLLLGSWLEGNPLRLSGMAISGYINATNGAVMLRSLARTLRYFGFNGLVILIDEVESILNLPKPRRRDSYQTLRLLVDRENMPEHTLVVASTTPPMFSDIEKGLSTYPALWSRLRRESNSGYINYNATLVDLTQTPLSETNYFNIGKCIQAIHARARGWQPAERVSDDFLVAVARIAASGRLTLTYSQTRVFVKLVTETLELAYQHHDYIPSIDHINEQFGEVDLRLENLAVG